MIKGRTISPGPPKFLHNFLVAMFWLLFIVGLAAAFNNPPGVDIWCGKAYRPTYEPQSATQSLIQSTILTSDLEMLPSSQAVG